MKIGDIYKHKTLNEYVAIACFARYLSGEDETEYIIICHLEVIEGEVGYSPYSNSITTSSELTDEYELFKSAEFLDTDKYNDTMDELKQLLQ